MTHSGQNWGWCPIPFQQSQIAVEIWSRCVVAKRWSVVSLGVFVRWIFVHRDWKQDHQLTFQRSLESLKKVMTVHYLWPKSKQSQWPRRERLRILFPVSWPIQFSHCRGVWHLSQGSRHKEIRSTAWSTRLGTLLQKCSFSDHAAHSTVNADFGSQVILFQGLFYLKF